MEYIIRNRRMTEQLNSRVLRSITGALFTSSTVMEFLVSARSMPNCAEQAPGCIAEDTEEEVQGQKMCGLESGRCELESQLGV